MRSLLALVSWLTVLSAASGQGVLNFANTPSTLISVGETPMPVSGVQQFIFAIFLAPPTTVGTTNQTAFFTDPAFQIAGGYNTNQSTTSGRVITHNNLDVGTAGGFSGGSTVDFVVRGWSANLGYTWVEFLVNWNNGNPSGTNGPYWWGSSTVGNDIRLNDVGSPVPSDTVFGFGASQVVGFNLVTVPEPSSLTMTGLGLAALWLRRPLVDSMHKVASSANDPLDENQWIARLRP